MFSDGSLWLHGTLVLTTNPNSSSIQYSTACNSVAQFKAGVRIYIYIYVSHYYCTLISFWEHLFMWTLVFTDLLLFFGGRAPGVSSQALHALSLVFPETATTRFTGQTLRSQLDPSPIMPKGSNSSQGAVATIFYVQWQ